MARDAPCREPALMGCCASPAATRVCCKVRSCQPACVFSASASRVRGLKADRLLSAILRPSSPFSLLDGALQTGRSVSKRTRLPGSLVRHCSAPLASGSAGGHTVAKAALERWRHRSGTAPPSADHRLLLQEALGAVWVQRLGTSHRNAFLVAKVQFVMYGSGTARGGPPSAPCTSALSLPARGGFASSTCQRAPGPISFGFPG